MRVPLTPAHHAQDLLNKLNIVELPIPIYQICDYLNIKCVETQEIDAEALIVKKHDKHDKPIIFVKANVGYDSRTKFSIAHELGHYILPSHLDNIYACTIEDLNSFTTSKTTEDEANTFAAELLMPSPWILNRIKREDVTLPVIKNIASECDTSLTATAIQVTNLCTDSIAIIFSVDGVIRWFSKSDSFRYYINLGSLHIASFAYKIFFSGELSEIPIKVPTQVWVDTYQTDQYFIEESLSMPKLNAVLTLLRCYIDEDDDENYDEY